MPQRWRGWMLAIIVSFGTASTSSALKQEEINQAIEKGVTALKKMQQSDGTWRYRKIGATALAGLALLECGVADDDPSVVKAAQAIRKECPRMTHTYSISCSIMFLDRLRMEQDRALIESLTVRLLAGQCQPGGWSYSCPPLADVEAKRIQDIVNQGTTLKGSRKLPVFDPKGPRRTVRDLPKEIQQQLMLIQRARIDTGMPDNSNTQFAAMALWIARRHGLPVVNALARMDRYFRGGQNPDGGWPYHLAPPTPGDFNAPRLVAESSRAAMTCAGILGLSLQHGITGELGRSVDPKRDRSLNAAIVALASTVGTPFRQPDDIDNPAAWRRQVRGIQKDAGGAYYYLWSLERVAVAINLKTIGKKDWYTWGAQLLLKSQTGNGTWSGFYGDSGADTCFALLFLKRSNLAFDLTTRFNRFGDPFQVTLRPGGIGGDPLKRRGPKMKSALDPGAKVQKGESNKGEKKLTQIPTEIEDDDVRRLSTSLVRAEGADQEKILRQLRDSKGSDYTEALASAIPLLEDDARKKARIALAQRLTRMSKATLKRYLKHTNSEVRRGTVLATAMKDERELIPEMIDHLDDPEALVVAAARAALKAMTKEDYGPEPEATPEERATAIRRWKTWWKRNGS